MKIDKRDLRNILKRTYQCGYVQGQAVVEGKDCNIDPENMIKKEIKKLKKQGFYIFGSDQGSLEDLDYGE